MLNSEQVKLYIQQGLSCDFVAVQGNDGQHFDAVIVSPEFTGRNIVKQHQLVYKALGEMMKAEIHALSLDTKEA